MTGDVRTQPVRDLLRDWRMRRRLSQLDLACGAEISIRYLSFLETGRSLTNCDMVLHLAVQLGIPLRERNALLMAAGYATVFSQRPLADSSLQAAHKAVVLILAGHEPYPMLAIDRHWTLMAANRAIPPSLAEAEPSLPEPPVNVIRLGLHPQGLAPRIVNLAQWRSHLLARLRRQVDATAVPVLAELLCELSGYPTPNENKNKDDNDYAGVAAPFKLATKGGILSFLNTTTVFGTPVDITLSGQAVESFFPADAAISNNLTRILKRDEQQI